MISVSAQGTVYSDIIASMQIGNAPWVPPKGPFYLLDGNIVPYTPNPTILRIETDKIGTAIRITIDQIGDIGSGVDTRQRQKEYTVVASSSVITTGVQLGQGRNLITVQILNSSSDVDYLIINASLIATLWEAFARVLYSVSINILTGLTQAITSDQATRLFEPFVSFQELLPDIQSLKVLALRLASKGLIHSVGTNLGVTDLIKSLSLSTPIYKRMDKDTFELFPALDPWVKSASQFGGLEAHVWLPNVEIAAWLSFLNYISSQPDLFTIHSITESEVIIEYQGEIQRHLFDFNNAGTSFLTAQATTQCFSSIVVNTTMVSYQIISMCAGAYTFDLYITDKNLLGNCRIDFDDSRALDSNCDLDADSIDPFTDGWINLSLSGRFEQDYPEHRSLDTFVIPSSTFSTSCSYEGWYTQLVKNHKYEIEFDANIGVTGYVQEGLAWFLTSPNGNHWMVYVNKDTETLVSKLRTISFIGDLTSGSAIIENIPSTENLLIGMIITGTGILSNTSILSVDSDTQITLTRNVSSTLIANPLIADISTEIISFKVTKPDSTEAAFAITNDGVLQVITPIGGEFPMTTLYIVSDDETSVWWVTVNNNNLLVITKIFPV